MASVIICSDFGAQDNSIVSTFICHEEMGPDAMILVFWISSFKPTFSLFFHFHQEALQFFFSFCHKGGVICISEVIDISPGNLDSYSAYKLNKQGDNIQPWHTPSWICNQSVVPCPVLTVASWHAYRFLRRTVRWSGIPIPFRIFHGLLRSTQSKALS